ncbi:MAG: ROK family protein [Candidatus Eremiobacter antarcticus]|nr:ROK family protein [Candidatus Eremiobacteraeota bacterium]MBC5807901.1 ROK family protein [Candidatus Eremiobacteraeota bacterium]
MKFAIGIDLGGTHTAAAAVSHDGTILARAERELSDLEPDVVVDEIDRAFNEVLGALDSADCVGVGIGAPGNIDEKTGSVRFSPNFHWHDVPLRALLEKRIKHPLHILNDARCATLGEYLYGSGKGVSEFALLTLGTGIGGGFIAGGKLVIGAAMGAGEVGHHVIRPDTGFVCGCGKIGCFEAQASGMGLLRHALALAPSFPRSSLLTRKPPERWGTKMIRKAVMKGDEHASAAWQRFLADLALGVSNIIAFMNPAVIALGGGVGQTDKSVLAQPLTKLVDALTTMVPKGMTRIVSATLGNDAGMIGAAALAQAGGVSAIAHSLDGVPRQSSASATLAIAKSPR